MPMLHSLCSTTFVPSTDEFTVGNARSASTAARMKNGMNVSLVPDCPLEFFLGFARSAAIGGNIHFVHRIHVRRNALRQHHVLRDPLPHHGHRLHFVIAEVHFLARYSRLQHAAGERRLPLAGGGGGAVRAGAAAEC